MPRKNMKNVLAHAGKGNVKNGGFSDEYKNKCFAIWDMNLRPTMDVLLKLLPPDEYGDVPKLETISKWKYTLNWEARSEVIKVDVQEQTDRMLVDIRMKMMQRHADMAQKVQDQAFEYLQSTGFDSSASAVAALFKGFEEEKRSRGMAQALSQIGTMNDNDLQKMMNRLLARSRGIGEVVDGETTIVSGDDLDATANE